MATTLDFILIQTFYLQMEPWEKYHGADMSSSVHIDNKYKDILILGEGITQGLYDTTLRTDGEYPINFT